LLEFREISKVYGTLRANDRLSFSLQEGRIHALIGENGAGKSTLMKILFGLEKPDGGEIFYKGKPATIRSPSDAKLLGMGMIHQHFQLASALTALDHVILEEPRSFFSSLFEKLDRTAWLKRLEELSNRFQMPVPWTETISQLPVGIQQRIEILKLLAFDARILILDEPTAVLTPHEIEQFLERLKQLRDSGKTIVLITHKLKEVLAVADDVTVLRQGRMVFTGPLAGQTATTLASKMVGTEFQPREFVRSPVTNEALLKVEGLSGRKGERKVLEKIQFALHGGEILGVAGVEGNGQSDLIRALVLPRESKVEWTGSAFLGSRNLLEMTNPEIRRYGVGLVPEDRLHQAVIPSLTAAENYQLGRTDLTRGLWIHKSQRDRELKESLEKFDVRPKNPKLLFSSFSGGNQQKLVLARELAAKPKLLVVAQPTRGVDIGAIEAIHETLMKARNDGMGILLISSELEELLRLSDRLLVFHRGEVRAQLDRGQFDLATLGRLMGGAQ
jgi:simple sugar transport system ATP-binding protein